MLMALPVPLPHDRPPVYIERVVGARVAEICFRGRCRRRRRRGRRRLGRRLGRPRHPASDHRVPHAVQRQNTVIASSADRVCNCTYVHRRTPHVGHANALVMVGAAAATAAPVCVVPVARTSSSSCRCGRRLPVKYKRSRTVPVGSRTAASGHPGCSHCTRGSAPRIGRNHMEAAGPVAGPCRCS